MNNDFWVTSEAICQWFSLVTSSLVKIMAKSPHSWPKYRYSRLLMYCSLYLYNWNSYTTKTASLYLDAPSSYISETNTYKPNGNETPPSNDLLRWSRLHRSKAPYCSLDAPLWPTHCHRAQWMHPGGKCDLKHKSIAYDWCNVIFNKDMIIDATVIDVSLPIYREWVVSWCVFSQPGNLQEPIYTSLQAMAQGGGKILIWWYFGTELAHCYHISTKVCVLWYTYFTNTISH